MKTKDERYWGLSFGDKLGSFALFPEMSVAVFIIAIVANTRALAVKSSIYTITLPIYNWLTDIHEVEN